jgi:hypothetical protein
LLLLLLMLISTSRLSILEPQWHLGTPEKVRSIAAQLVSAIETR